MPEKYESKFYNTGKEFILYLIGFCFDPNGQLVAKYRKTHLFDIDIPGKITFKESDTFAAGEDYCVFDTPYARFGIGICYDIR
jgi:omega-amidase